MPTAAPSLLASSVEKTNGAKLSRLLIDGESTVLRKVFDGYHPPANLAADLNACYSILNNLLRRRILNGHQWDKLFPPGGVAPDSNTFDITLLFLLLTNICGLSPPPSGWHSKPPASDTSLEANLARVKFSRNVLYGHVTTTGVDTPTFTALWLEISAVLVALGFDQTEIDRLKAEHGGEEDYLDALREWADSEEDIKSQLKNIHQTQIATRHTVEKVHQTHINTQQALEDVRQTQIKDHEVLQYSNLKLEGLCHVQTTTQQTVKEVRQTQIEAKEALLDSNVKLEEVRQTQNITKQTVEEVRQSQTEDRKTLQNNKSKLKEVKQSQTEMQQSVEKMAAGLQEVKEAVHNLKEGRDESRADEFLRNLAKSEFKGDIEYYVGRFQVGTREWVFNRVQNWLDNRSSQNRVMVISGIAGIGKSVIAAVICKKMQEAGRLSGSHFCQHNNPRYNNPQLMLQSLACHLSHALPEYKEALVEQLSRNHRTDLINMNVEELFALLFKEPLNSLSDPGRIMPMVIDGLDESEYKGRNDLLDVIANQFCKLPSWIRFLVTTRPATNIAEKLKKLKPLQLETDDEKNVEDIRTVLQGRLQHLIKLEDLDAIMEKLVLKCEGLMLYAHFLILYIEEHPEVLDKGNLTESVPLGISSVYHSYFKRLEDELRSEELDVKDENFLNLLCAITAAREALPVGFVAKVLVRSRNSPLAKRKVRRALRSVSSLLPIRNDCLHVIHKSVNDWLTDSSCYGEHDFTVNEEEGHRTLADLCRCELDDLKQRGVSVHNAEFSASEKYALHHGARHMFYSVEERRPCRLEELTKAYIVDLELLFAKLCVNNTTVAEDLLWLQREGISTMLSEGVQSTLDTFLFLLRKHHHVFTTHPRVFLQTALNEGGTVLSAEASNLLQNKYPGIPHMEYVHKETRREGVIARFRCSSRVACLDVSPNLDFMVCECRDGMLSLWSLHTGSLLWKRPVKVTKNYFNLFNSLRMGPLAEHGCSPVFLFYRSVTFHPSQDLVLPGILSHAYTVDGDLKPPFLQSNCRFSVCSISGDKTKILTDCPENAKCLVMWSLNNGFEIARVYRSDDVLSFAWSRDGSIIAISHSTGLICLVDATSDFRTLAQTSALGVCGMIKFSPDHRVLFCLHYSSAFLRQFRVNVMDNHHTFSLDVSSSEMSYDHREFESFSDCGFLLGDPIPSSASYFEFHFVLNKQTLLKISRFESDTTMLNIKDQTRNGQHTAATTARKIALSLNGETAYLVTYSPAAIVMAWDVSSGELIAEKKIGITRVVFLVPVREGVLLGTINGTVALWNFDLSECIRRLGYFPYLTKLIPISEKQVACVTKGVEVNVLDTTSAEIVSTIPVFQRKVIACNSKCQIITDGPGSLQLSDSTTLLWKKYSSDFDRHPKYGLGASSSDSASDSGPDYDYHVDVYGAFSPGEQSVVIWSKRHDCDVWVIDAFSGKTLFTWRHSEYVRDCKFVSDKEFVVSCGGPLKLFNVKSGDMLSVIDVGSKVSCLAACPSKRLMAVGFKDSTRGFKVIRVWLPGDEGNRKNKKMDNGNRREEQRSQNSNQREEQWSQNGNQREEQRSQNGNRREEQRSQNGIGREEQRSQNGIGREEQRSQNGIGREEQRSQNGTGREEQRSQNGIGREEQRSQNGTGRKEQRSQEMKKRCVLL